MTNKLTKVIITYKSKGTKIEKWFIKNFKKSTIEFSIRDFNIVKEEFIKLLDKDLIEIEFI